MCTENERTAQYAVLYEESLEFIDQWQAEREGAPRQVPAPIAHIEVDYHPEDITTIHQTIIQVGSGSGAIRLRLIVTFAVLALATIAVIALYQAIMALLPLLIAILHVVFIVLTVLFLLAALVAVLFGIVRILPALLTLWERVAAWRACRQSAARPHEVAYEEYRRHQ